MKIPDPLSRDSERRREGSVSTLAILRKPRIFLTHTQIFQSRKACCRALQVNCSPEAENCWSAWSLATTNLRSSSVRLWENSKWVTGYWKVLDFAYSLRGCLGEIADQPIRDRSSEKRDDSNQDEDPSPSLVTSNSIHFDNQGREKTSEGSWTGRCGEENSLISGVGEGEEVRGVKGRGSRKGKASAVERISNSYSQLANRILTSCTNHSWGSYILKQKKERVRVGSKVKGRRKDSMLDTIPLSITKELPWNKTI